MPDKIPIKYSDIFSIHDLLRWISESQQDDWVTADKLNELVTLAMRKIRGLNY